MRGSEVEESEEQAGGCRAVLGGMEGKRNAIDGVIEIMRHECLHLPCRESGRIVREMDERISCDP